MRLDAHHSFSERYPLASLETILKRNRFDGSILVDAAPPSDPPAFVRAVVRKTQAFVAADLGHWQEHQARFRGVCALAGDFGELAPRALTLDFSGPLTEIPTIACRYPDLRIAIPHLGKPEGEFDEHWADALAAAARCPNVYCKLSALPFVRLPLSYEPGGHPGSHAHPSREQRERSDAGALSRRDREGAVVSWRVEDLRPLVEHALSVFGRSRLMFGSGWPAGLPDHPWKESLAAFTQSIGARSIEFRELLLGGNAARFYGIAE